MSEPAPSPAAPAAVTAASGGGEPRQLDSRSLFGTARELLIEHKGQCYRLRLTRADKLILTK